MFTRLFVLLVAALAVLLNFPRGGPPERPPYVQGRNKTVLFVTTKMHGLSNVHIATASALLEDFPDIEVHYATFPGIRSKLDRVSAFARAKTPAARDINVHELQGVDFQEALERLGHSIQGTITDPASKGIATLTRHIQHWISPWSVEDHLYLYNEIGRLIDEVDPAVVVLETLLQPALDIARDRNRQHAILTPNNLLDNFRGDQPRGTMFWKYPAVMSGFPFPVPLSKIPENIYLNMRFIYSALRTPALASKKVALREHGLKDPVNLFGIHRPDVPWITMDTEGISIPVDFIPVNVTRAGPILLRSAPADEQDPELTRWMKKAPTILVNLGGLFRYAEPWAKAMAGALAKILAETDFQVIWKFNKDAEYSEDIFIPLNQYIESGRLKMSEWLIVDPSALLDTGDIVASVHHGGSSCFNEAVSAGIPHVILPLWADLYNYAARVEDLGIGLWACKETSPNWTADCISSTILEVVDNSKTGIARREKAKQLGEMVRSRESGRTISARVIADLAYVK